MRKAGFLFGMFLVCATVRGNAEQALNVRWLPANPVFSDSITIEVSGCTNNLLLHWGVNAKGNQWNKPLVSYIPAHSRLDGVAAKTPFEKADSNGIQRTTIGPFDSSAQEISTIDFVLHDGGTNWYNNDKKDYHIPVSRGRIGARPKHPAVNDPIVIKVHRSAPGGQLRWGVNAVRGKWEPPAPVYYPAGTVASDDGLAVDTPLPPPDDNGISTMVLGPFNEGSQVVTSLHMAVHWDKQWDTDFGRNYNVSIALDDPALQQTPSFIEPQQEQTFSAPFFTAILESDSPVTVWLDGSPAGSLSNEPYALSIMTDKLDFGKHRLTAQNGTSNLHGIAVCDFWFTPSFKTVYRPLEAPLGATIDDNRTVTFALYAPGKHFVTLIGSFNDWDPVADPMNYSTNGIWWLSKRLPRGSYDYQYMIDGEKRLADPYSTDVTWVGTNNNEHWSPELAKSVIEVGSTPFNWQDENYNRPPLNKLIIYELSIQDLCPGEGFTGVIQRLDDIKALGVTAIEPMPWNEFTGSESWGYNPSFHMAPESTLGTPKELKQLVNEAHKRGLAVIMDAVFNHMDGNSPLFQLYGDDYDASPYFYLFTGENWGFPDLDQESPAFKRYIADVLDFWIQEYHIDGFRYDATRWVDWKGYNDYGASWFAFAAKQSDSNSIQIAEHIPADPNLVNQTEMDSGWHAYFRWQIKDAVTDARLHTSDFIRVMSPELLGYSNVWQRIAYTESHDEQRIMYEMDQKHYQPDEAANRAISALVLTLTAPGIPMLYAGQEFGEYTPKRVGANPLNTSLQDFPLNRRILDATRILCHLRNSLPALTGDDFELVFADENQDTVVYRRGTEENQVLVGINLSRERRMLHFPLIPGTWSMPLKQKEITAQKETAIGYPLRPGEAVLFVKKE